MAGTTTPNMDSINLDQACKFLIQDDPDFKKQVKKMILENLRVPESTTSASTAQNSVAACRRASPSRTSRRHDGTGGIMRRKASFEASV